MSYEGSREFLCKNGHYNSIDAYDDDLTSCPDCGARMAFVNSVDHTNGWIEVDPTTEPAAKHEIGKEDVWHTDHHGNRYALQRTLFAPDNGSRWRPISWPDLPATP